MNTRKIAMLGMWLVVVGVFPAWAQYPDEVRQALQMAVQEAQAAIAASTLPAGQPISLLPIRGDQHGYVEGLLKNAVTAAGRQYVEGKEDPFWDEVLREIAWDEYKGDLLDPASIVKFGKLKATKILMYGAVRQADLSGQRVFVELELHASSVVTKEHLWGGTFAKRFYLPGARQGLVALNDTVRQALKKAFTEGAASLGTSEKLKSVRTVLVVPLAGDINGYITGLAKDMFRDSRITPTERDVATLGEARVLLRDQPQQADAVLCGAVRDLYREPREWRFEGTNYEVHAEVQLEVQTAAANEVLWSATLSVLTNEFVKIPVMPVEEVKIGVWRWLKKNPLAVAWIAVGIVLLVVVLIIFRALIRAATRVR